MDYYQDFLEMKQQPSETGKSKRDTVMDRQKERKGRRTSRRRRFWTFVLVFLFLIGTIAGVIYAHTHDMLNIEQIQVSGNSFYETLAIVDMAGATTGVPILTTGTKPMKQALQQAPYIKTAKISKKLPHTLKITIVERQEAYAVSLAGAYVILDTEQYNLRKANTNGGYVVIEGFVPSKLTIGEPFIVENQVTFNETIELAAAMAQSNIKVGRLAFKDGLVKAYFTEKLICETTIDNFMKYLAELNEILYDLESRNVERGTIHIGDNAYFSYSPVIE